MGSARRPGPEEPGRYVASVRGRVVSPDGRGVARVRVGWTDIDAPPTPDDWYGVIHTVALTNDRGAYEVNLLPPGPCRFVAGRFGLPGGEQKSTPPARCPSGRARR